MKLVTIIPFVPEYLPIWKPQGPCDFVQDGCKQDPFDPSLRTEVTKDSPITHSIYMPWLDRRGFSRTMNHAIEQAYYNGYDVALIWNSDAKMIGEPDRLLRLFEEDDTVAAVAPAKEYHGKDSPATNREVYPDRVGCSHVVLTEYGPFFRTEDRNVVREVVALSYCPLFAVRIEAFIACGGYSTEFSPGFYEDADLWYKLRRFGWKTLVDTSVTYTHGDDDGASKTFSALHSPGEISGQGARALAILLAKWGVLPPLQAPLRLSPIDPIQILRRDEVSSNDDPDLSAPAQSESKPCPTEAEK